jgi:hypothetical protein
MTKQCTHCGKENDTSIQNCINCGNPTFTTSKGKSRFDLPSWAYLILWNSISRICKHWLSINMDWQNEKAFFDLMWNTQGVY